MCQSEECFASRIGFRVCLTTLFALLVTAIICNVQMMMVEMHGAKAANKSSGSRHYEDNHSIIMDVTTQQMMMSGDLPSRNHSHVLIWTDRDSEDMFSLVLKQRLEFLRKSHACPIIEECSFHYDKKRSIEQSDTIVIVSKRHFPYGGKESGKTWTLLLPDPDFHRAWIKHGSHRHLDLKLLISYLPLISGSNIPLVKFGKTPRKTEIMETSTHRSADDLRLAAVIIDECDTEGRREAYVKALQQHASVHIYGRCGAPCPGWVTEDCLKYLDQHYKFFLVFESHICQHFLSPELWRFLATTTNMIPVVFGGVNYADVLPPEVGYIDALNHSPEDLGRTLNYLKANATAFDKYKAWRHSFHLQLTEWPCSLCERLRSSSTRLQDQASIKAQASSDGLCTTWPTLDFNAPASLHVLETN